MKAFILACLFASVALGQAVPSTYPYAVPLPTNGSTPNGTIKLGGVLNTSDYRDPRPVVWDVMTGGLPRIASTTTEMGQINANQRKQGMEVYCVDSGNSYRLGSDLITWTLWSPLPKNTHGHLPNANFTLTTNFTVWHQSYTPLTANRVATLPISPNVNDGFITEIVRDDTASFNLIVGGLVTLHAGEAASFSYSSVTDAWTLLSSSVPPTASGPVIVYESAATTTRSMTGVAIATPTDITSMFPGWSASSYSNAIMSGSTVRIEFIAEMDFSFSGMTNVYDAGVGIGFLPAGFGGLIESYGFLETAPVAGSYPSYQFSSVLELKHEGSNIVVHSRSITPMAIYTSGPRTVPLITLVGAIRANTTVASAFNGKLYATIYGHSTPVTASLIFTYIKISTL